MATPIKCMEMFLQKHVVGASLESSLGFLNESFSFACGNVPRLGKTSHAHHGMLLQFSVRCLEMFGKSSYPKNQLEPSKKESLNLFFFFFSQGAGMDLQKYQ